VNRSNNQRQATLPEALIPPHGGYRTLKCFHLAQLIYDITVRFCERYIDKRSRTCDQMVQAARSGGKNIAEGSQVSGTSKKFELKLTSVARGSLEELRGDYQDFLRHRGLEEWSPEHPALAHFRARRCKTIEEVKAWVDDERQRARTNTDGHGRTRTRVASVPLPGSAQLVANGALSLLNICCYLLDQQINRLAKDFEEKGGFTERLYRIRTQRKIRKP
jgi:four helix bundle suffix protein